jgi:transcriptional regulator with XRE-family HTH domain
MPRSARPLNVERFRVGQAAAGLTDAALARALEVSESTIRAWERGGSSPTAHNLMRLAQVLHLTVDDLTVTGAPTLAAVRVQRGLHQVDVATRLGVSITTYARWERGDRRMREDAVGDVARVLEISPDLVRKLTRP